MQDDYCGMIGGSLSLEHAQCNDCACEIGRLATGMERTGSFEMLRRRPQQAITNQHPLKAGIRDPARPLTVVSRKLASKASKAAMARGASGGCAQR